MLTIKPLNDRNRISHYTTYGKAEHPPTENHKKNTSYHYLYGACFFV